MGCEIELLGDAPARVNATEGETILSALLAAGLPFAHDCQAGNCGSCKCELISGDITELPYSEFALDAQQRARNLILACRSQVWGDCVVRALDQDEFMVHPSRVLQCRVAALADLTHDIKQLRLDIEAGGPFDFSPGQYAQVEFAPGLTRDFSMANTPHEQQLEFNVRRVADGAATEYLFHKLGLGDGVRVSGPLGMSYLRANHRGPMLAVAGGSGLAPIRSIIETALRADAAREIHLYLGVREERDVYWEARMRDLAAAHPRFSYQIVLSEQRSERRRHGLVSDAIAADLSDLSGFKAYLAGPPPMVAATQRSLERNGLALRDIHSDPFYTQAKKV